MVPAYELQQPPCPDTGGDATSGEELASDVTINETVTPRKKGKGWNNKQMARWWLITHNNYTPEDQVNWKQALLDGYEKGVVTSAIVSEEVRLKDFVLPNSIIKT